MKHRYLKAYFYKNEKKIESQYLTDKTLESLCKKIAIDKIYILARYETISSHY